MNIRYQFASMPYGKFCVSDLKYGVHCIFSPFSFTTEEVVRQNQVFFDTLSPARRKTILQGIRKFLVDNHYQDAFQRYEISQTDSDDAFDITHIEYHVTDKVYQIEYRFMAHRFAETKQLKMLDPSKLCSFKKREINKIVKSLEDYIENRLYLISGAETRYIVKNDNHRWQVFDLKNRVIIHFEEKQFNDTYRIEALNQKLFSKAFEPDDVDRIIDEAIQYLVGNGYRRFLK